jgi:hypothetical protein
MNLDINKAAVLSGHLLQPSIRRLNFFDPGEISHYQKLAHVSGTPSYRSLYFQSWDTFMQKDDSSYRLWTQNGSREIRNHQQSA